MPAVEIAFAAHHSGGVYVDFKGTGNLGDQLRLPVTAIPDLTVGTILRFVRDYTPGTLVGGVLVPTRLGDGTIAVINGIAEYEVIDIVGQTYVLSRGET